jgi:hypothetical protein
MGNLFVEDKKMVTLRATQKRYFIINFRYLLFAIILFVVEVLIALYVRDSIVRPYVGDYLVVIMIYCFVKAFIKASPLKVAIGVLLFAYLIEALQYFNFLEAIGLEKNKVARIVLGHGFEWMDLVAYTLGIGTVLLLEWGGNRKIAKFTKAAAK